MKFKKEDLKALAYEEYDPEEFKILKNDLIDSSRWSLIYDMVFMHKGKFYLTSYSEGATEIQEERPYEYDPDEIECLEVFPVEKVVVTYVPKREVA